MNYSTIKQQLGCWLHERWRTEFVLRAPRLASAMGLTWQDLCNRHERIGADEVSSGRVCFWEYSSQLTVARLTPEIGGRLLTHCMKEWPVSFTPSSDAMPRTTPDISVIVGVRGTARTAQFQGCLASLRAQRNVAHEVIVVEQSWTREYHELVPNDVVYIHQQATHPDMPYNRSWALNMGARAARGKVIVLHDADMVVPRDFCRAILDRMTDGVDALRLPRFIFYLDEPTSSYTQQSLALPQAPRVDTIVQNTRTPIAVTTDAYESVGGHDEAFYGWGAEDDEFMDRLRTRNVAEGALPIVHLWHPVAPNRLGDRNEPLIDQRRNITPADRIAELSRRDWGRDVPSIPWTSHTLQEGVTKSVRQLATESTTQ